MPKRFAPFLLALSLVAFPAAHARAPFDVYNIATTPHPESRFEIIRFDIDREIVLKIDKVTGETWYLESRDRRTEWESIRNDSLARERDPSADRPVYQAFATLDAAFLYNDKTGHTWWLERGPTGYGLQWTPLP